MSSNAPSGQASQSPVVIVYLEPYDPTNMAPNAPSDQNSQRPVLQACHAPVDSTSSPLLHFFSRQLLCSRSAWFDNALNGGWTEASLGDLIPSPKSRSSPIIIRQTTSETFRVFKHWLKTGSIMLPANDPNPLTADTMLDLAVFADYYCIPTLEATILKHQRQHLRDYHPYDQSLPLWRHIQDACERLPESSPLLKLWANGTAARSFFLGERKKSDEEGLTTRFLLDSIDAIIAVREGARHGVDVANALLREPEGAEEPLDPSLMFRSNPDNDNHPYCRHFAREFFRNETSASKFCLGRVGQAVPLEALLSKTPSLSREQIDVAYSRRAFFIWDTPETIRHFKHWLETGSIEIPLRSICFDRVLDLAVFAEHYHIPALTTALLAHERPRVRQNVSDFDPVSDPVRTLRPQWTDLVDACNRLHGNSPLLLLWANGEGAMNFERERYTPGVTNRFANDVLNATAMVRHGNRHELDVVGHMFRDPVEGGGPEEQPLDPSAIFRADPDAARRLGGYIYYVRR
ncbi:hypothetical protein K490DRAFT_52989 [Saccharata proteae CBS 121410]|uniref:BTB domain-containing protein n=1 Tax=Saccharata proteae CBS 121410 TaxID=1314787 RepID=A0A9P4I3I3_9PEZI|nr:hypothetical protein K490DRAFT_52989 [Saccharata proteae CBS 121410]